MRQRQHLIDAFRAAMAEELRLYELIKNHGPGMDGFDAKVWAQWLDAVSNTTEASRTLREGFDDAAPSPTASP